MLLTFEEYTRHIDWSLTVCRRRTRQTARQASINYAGAPPHGIRVNVVAPGTILTYHLEAAGAEAQRQAGLAAPMRRIGTVTEVAETVLWLCSPQSSFITGAVIPIDGGQSAGVKPPQMYRQGQRMTAPPDGVPDREPAAHGVSTREEQR